MRVKSCSSSTPSEACDGITKTVAEGPECCRGIPSSDVQGQTHERETRSEVGLAIMNDEQRFGDSISAFPTGTSKWNKIEH